uniref:Uncharacterized protein n=1 Tax=Cacopsylla melanoneura TaxID=428564 RepID=A0A8D8RZE1_9HEMI
MLTLFQLSTASSTTESSFVFSLTSSLFSNFFVISPSLFFFSLLIPSPSNSSTFCISLIGTSFMSTVISFPNFILNNIVSSFFDSITFAMSPSLTAASNLAGKTKLHFLSLTL